MDRIVLNADLARDRISRHLYGHFSEHLGRCIYDGFWVGEDSGIPNVRGVRTDLVDALREIAVPNLRWPGGCFADEYHWQDGIGPRASRPSMVNTHWGGVTESNAFGTHEFLDLCAQLGCDPYICGNVGSGTVREMQQWVEYLTHEGPGPMADRRRENGRKAPWAVPFWGVGNENWGCGGHMRAEYYADEYCRYQTYVRSFGREPIRKIACGPSGRDLHWTEVMMHQTRRRERFLMDGLALHHYTHYRGHPARGFGEEDWFEVLRRALAMEDLIRRHGAIMERYDPEGRVGLVVDEWGTWYDVEPGTNPGFLFQQNTMRDALVAALTLNIFHRHCRRVRMANIAQTVNVLQAMVLTEGERMLRTPSYHVFSMYKIHQDALSVPCETAGEAGTAGEGVPAVHASASRNQEGGLALSLAHTDPARARRVAIEVRGSDVSTGRATTLCGDGMTAHNTFDAPDAVRPEDAGEIRVRGGRAEVELPPASVTVVAFGHTGIDGQDSKH